MKFCKIRFLGINYLFFFFNVCLHIYSNWKKNRICFNAERSKEENFYFIFVKNIAIQGSSSITPVCHSSNNFQELHFPTTNIRVSHSQLGIQVQFKLKKQCLQVWGSCVLQIDFRLSEVEVI